MQTGAKNKAAKPAIRARRGAVRDLVTELRCNFACLHEIKVADVDARLVTETLGPAFGQNFIYRAAVGTRGGILMACTDDFSLRHEPLADGPNSITRHVTDKSNGDSWTISGVYGPQDDSQKYCSCRS